MGFNKIEIDGEAIYLNRSKLGWKVVHPIKNEDGTINWKNLISGGSWFNLVLVAIFVIVMVGFIFEYHNNLQQCSEIMSRYNLEKNITSMMNPGYNNVITPNFHLDKEVTNETRNITS